MAAISNDWLQPLQAEFKKPYYKDLYYKIRDEYSKFQIFPEADDIFNAFQLTPLSEVKVVILGQDPYHNVGQAHGLSFSVKPEVDIPPSLVNIYQELHDDLGCYIPDNGYLKKWAEQGVLLLNTVLTVRAHNANSHRGIGWEQFTDEVILRLATGREHLVFILWGSYAIKKGAFINRMKHLVLTSPHPSPLSAYRGFFGNKHFSRANAYLVQHGMEPIDW